MFYPHQQKTDDLPHGNNAMCHMPKNSQMHQPQEQSKSDNPHPSSAVNPCHHAVAYNGDLSELVNILQQRKNDARVKRFRQIFPTGLFCVEYALGYQIRLSCPNFGKTNLSTVQNLICVVHGAIAKLAHRQALHAIRQAYPTQNKVSAHQALQMVGWYGVFCRLAYRLCPSAYRFSPIIRLFKS